MPDDSTLAFQCGVPCGPQPALSCRRLHAKCITMYAGLRYYARSYLCVARIAQTSLHHSTRSSQVATSTWSHESIMKLALDFASFTQSRKTSRRLSSDRYGPCLDHACPMTSNVQFVRQRDIEISPTLDDPLSSAIISSLPPCMLICQDNRSRTFESPGGRYWTRTSDLLLVRQALSPTELTAPLPRIRKVWRAWRGSNPRPRPPQGRALSI